jgi:hypothetical protein
VSALASSNLSWADIRDSLNAAFAGLQQMDRPFDAQAALRPFAHDFAALLFSAEDAD